MQNSAIGQIQPEGSQLQDNSRGLEFLSGERKEAEYQGARKHSSRVRMLKIVLPAIAGLIILGFVAVLVIRQIFLPQIDLGAIRVTDGKLVMEHPNLNGFDSEKRPYSLAAEKAIQDAKQPKVVELVEIQAKLPVDDTISAEVIAGHGVYDAEAKTLVLSKQVFVQTSNGMRVDLEDADIDIDKGTLKTSNPIFASSEQADISAASLTVDESGEHLVFEGSVEIILRPRELKEAGAANE